MKTVILCIDRDNDIGSKGKVETPIIGREENVRAALALGLADPEDADTNTLLAAIKLYDQMVREGENVEVATICGDVDVGVKSDRTLARQLDEVIEVVAPKHAILVSNGAEDEFIFQMVSSRLKIDHVHDVYVKQSRRLESWYYYIVKVAKEPKLRRKVVVPISLIFILLGLFYLYPVFLWLFDYGARPSSIVDFAFPTVSVIIGIYILWRAYMVGDTIIMGAKKTKDSIYAGDLSLIFFVAAILLVITGAANGMSSVNFNETTQSLDWFRKSMIFLATGVIWFGVAAIALEARKAVNAIATRDSIPSDFWSVMTSLVGVTILLLGAMHYIVNRLVEKENLPELLTGDVEIFAEVAIGFVILIIGYIMQRRGKVDVVSIRDRWRR